MIEISQDTEPVLPPTPFNTELARLRSALYRDLGVLSPASACDSQLVYRAESTACFSMKSHLVGKASAREVVRPREGINLEMIGIEFTKEKLFLPRMESIWVADSYREKLQSADISFLNSRKS
jgi:type III secretion protein V